MRQHGNYISARHKFQKAIKVEPGNRTAKEELKMVERIIQLDKEIPIEAVYNVKQNNKRGISVKDAELNEMKP
jgi:hypothetical protein